MSQQTPPHIHAESVGITYHGVPALADVSLHLPAGQITALIGPSGCGKTSFLTAINRLADLTPGARITGRITLDANDIYAPAIDPVALRRRVGHIFQQPNPFPLSIHANLLLPLREHRRSDRPQWDAIITDALQSVGLWDDVHDRLHSPALALSGGQQQRLCIARALVLQPQVLLFDEPCSALDPIAAATVETHIASLRHRCTIVLVTNNIAQARRLADHIAVFWRHHDVGRLLESGPAATLLAAPSDPTVAAYLHGHTG